MIGLTRLIRAGGLLVCRGVDLNVREKVVRSLRLEPVRAHLEEIHNADSDLDARKTWPWRYASLEPLEKSRRNWQQRYAAIFQIPSAADSASSKPLGGRAASA